MCAAEDDEGEESRLGLMNRGAKLREFVVGEKVLYRIPGLSCKLADFWEGPYVVLERIGDVNYRICREGKEKHSKVVHVNCVKKYCERGSIARLDVVVDETEEERNKLSGVCEGFDGNELDELLGRYREVFSDVPGNTTKVVLKIETGDNPPFRQAPYSVPLGLREEVRKELGSLEKCGVIERCDGQWASPLVPVRKQDGGVRLCMDYRRLNALTVKEPYYIPGFEEMIEMVGNGRFVKGFSPGGGCREVSG